MSVKATLREKLEAALKPEALEIIDDSAKHAGHAGAPEGGESHFKVHIVSREFEGLNRVARHRMVFTVVEAEMKGRVHALQIKAFTPDEVS